MIQASRTSCSAILLVLLACASGCGVQYVVHDGNTGYPAQVVKSGWTNTGCIESLHTTATDFGVSVRLVRVERDYEGALFGLFPAPYFPMYVCYGEVIPPVDKGWESRSPAGQIP